MTTGVELRIGHLYAQFLNIYGDRGNIISLVKRCQWRGFSAQVQAVGLDDPLPLSSFDFLFIGGGQDRQQQVIAEDLHRRGSELRHCIESGAVILSVCGGYQLLGHYYRPFEGPELKGVSLVDAWTLAGNRRMIGNVVIKRSDGSTLVGFENHSGRTVLGEGVPELGRVIVGNGNNGDDGKEGVACPVGKGMLYGTYLHGSLLPKNPAFADEIIGRSLARRYGTVELQALDDSTEIKAHKSVLSMKA